MTDAVDERWPERTWLLAGLGGIAGWLCWLILDRPGDPGRGMVSLALLLSLATGLFAFTLDRVRIGWSVAYSVGAALTAALIVYWNDVPGPHSESDITWRFLCLAVVVGISLPLFQTARDAGRFTFPYPTLHRHAWTNVVIAFGTSFLFTLTVYLLFALWAGLFKLIGVNFFYDLFTKPWFMAMASGATTAAGIALLRDWSRVVGALQKVVMAVLGVLAPVLGIILLLFIAFLPFTGLGRLWETTRHTTPLMLGAILFALLLANAVVHDRPEEAPRSPLLRFGAMALGLSMLPLAIIAAVSTGKRIAAYGLMPDIAREMANGLTIALAIYRALVLTATPSSQPLPKAVLSCDRAHANNSMSMAN